MPDIIKNRGTRQATIIVRNCKYGTLSVLSTPYRWDIGDIIYPLCLREQFPNEGENRHMVMFYSETSDVSEVRELLERAQTRSVRRIRVQ